MAANALFNVPAERKTRRKEEFIDISKFTDRELRERFHFGLEAIIFISNLLSDKLQRATKRSFALTPLQQVLITLRFYASGSFFQCIGDCMGVDKSTVSRVVSNVTDALVEMSQMFVQWPCDAEKQRIRTGFYSLGGFPNVIGCIDGTHIRIQAPTEDEKSYVNRKSYHSINVMAVCDDRGIFTNINASWPGSAHDSHVFRSSKLHDFLERNNKSLEDGVLLGDSGYACTPYLLTPYRNPDTAAKERYQERHTSTRVTIERTFGRWKRRFHVLHSEIKLEPSKVCKIGVACAVLHNIAILFNEPEPDQTRQDEEELLMPPTPPYFGRETGRDIRDHLATEFFSN